MKRFAMTAIPLVLGALAANCDGSDDGGDPGSSGASSTGASAGLGSGGEGDNEPGAASGEGPGEGGAAGRAGASTGGTAATAGCVGVATGCSGGDVMPAITAVAWLQPDSCERFVAYEVRDVRDQDGRTVTDFTCEWTFSDGGVVNTCAGTKSFGELPGAFDGTVVVRSSATGATTTATSETVRVIEPQALEILAISDGCMQFSYDIDRQYGCGGTHILDIQPAENILTPGPWSTSSQTLQVAAPGVYTVTYTVEGCDESYARTCVASTMASVPVAECP